MVKKEVWYTIEKSGDIWTVWRNVDRSRGDRGVVGSRGIFKSGKRPECVEFCKELGVDISRVRQV